MNILAAEAWPEMHHLGNRLVILSAAEEIDFNSFSQCGRDLRNGKSSSHGTTHVPGPTG